MYTRTQCNDIIVAKVYILFLNLDCAGIKKMNYIVVKENPQTESQVAT